MKISLEKVLAIHLSIRNMKKKEVSNKWAFAITKNKAKIQGDIEGIAASEQKFIAIQQEQDDYVREHGKPDESGQPVVDKNDAGILEIHGRFEKELEAHQALLKTEVDIELHVIPFSDVPATISQEDLENLLPMIAEPK
jgi:hypothetical protein